MKARSLRAAIATATFAIAVCIASLVFGAASASAQCCPSYNVGITTMGACAALTINTTWGGGVTGGNTYTTPGVYTEPAPAVPGCWPGPLVGITINGLALGPCPGRVLLPAPCGCVWVCSVVNDETGCVAITVTPC